MDIRFMNGQTSTSIMAKAIMNAIPALTQTNFTRQAYKFMLNHEEYVEVFGVAPIEFDLMPYAVTKNLKLELLERQIKAHKREIHDPWIVREIKIIIFFIKSHLICLKKRCQILLLKIIG